MYKWLLVVFLITGCGPRGSGDVPIEILPYALSPFPAWVIEAGDDGQWEITVKCAREFSFGDYAVHGEHPCEASDWEGEVVYAITTDQLMELIQWIKILKGGQDE